MKGKRLITLCTVLCITVLGASACNSSAPKSTNALADSAPSSAEASGQSTSQAEPASEALTLESITIHAKMTSFGKMAESIELQVNDVQSLLDLSADDFMLSGCCMEAVSGTIGEYPAKNITFTNNSVIVEAEPFLIDKSNGENGEAFALNCTNDTLSFTYDAITKISCPEYDAFTDEEITVGGTTLNYKLYTPASSTETPLPIVIYNHGGGITGYDSILGDSFACSWATTASQSKMPCYVLAPHRASVSSESVNTDEEREAIKAVIDQLIAKGNADPERIYMTGESMGSIYSITFANTYPDYLAAIVLMNGGPLDIPKETSLEDSVKMNLESPWSDEELKALADSKTSVMFVQGIGDPLSYPLKFATVYNKLINYGMTPGNDLMWESYTAEQFNALLNDNSILPPTDSSEVAVDPITGKETYTNGNFHNTSRVAGWDTYVKNWMMIQTLSEAPAYTPVEASTDIPDSFSKIQIVNYAHETGNELEVTCAINEEGTEFYLSYMFFGDLQIAQGTIDGDKIEVTYDRTGFATGDASKILAAVDESAWEQITK